MISNLLAELQQLSTAFRDNALFVTGLLGIIWGVSILNWLLDKQLSVFGIIPRDRKGILGVFCSPFLHGNLQHLVFNSFPFFLLASLVMLDGRPIFWIVSAFIILAGGLLTWLFGRKAIHIGASGLVMGYFGYLLASIYLRDTIIAVLLVVVCIYYCSGLLLALFPSEEKSSWEGHVFGFIAGIAANFLLPYLVVNGQLFV